MKRVAAHGVANVRVGSVCQNEHKQHKSALGVSGAEVDNSGVE